MYAIRSYYALFAMDLDTATDSLTYVNAGHCPAFLSDAFGQRELPATSFMCGAFETTFTPEYLPLKAPWSLLLYTDGFYEWFATKDEVLGYDRFRDHCLPLLGRPDFVLADLPRSVSALAPAGAYDDDLTALHLCCGDKE